MTYDPVRIEFINEFRPVESKSGQDMAGEEISQHEPFIPTGVYQALKEKKRFDSMRVSLCLFCFSNTLIYGTQGGQQEDAEEFLGFFLDTLEEELSLLLANQTPGAIAPEVTTNGATGDSGDGWQEVGRKNKPILTRTVSFDIICSGINFIDNHYSIRRPNHRLVEYLEESFALH